ncbi:MAG TPA: hypothetical protein VGV64_01130 [Thermoplasmata archaeon]|nr:hypothetical protein [Thermoplasmata archaeon]HEV2428438.1 hypothetical protein [Thermoplasmata archaeon]
MSEVAPPFISPYAPSPGTSTPSPTVSPKEGISEFWAFFWLALANTTIIAVAGIATWLLVHRP